MLTCKKIQSRVNIESKTGRYLLSGINVQNSGRCSGRIRSFNRKYVDENCKSMFKYVIYPICSNGRYMTK